MARVETAKSAQAALRQRPTGRGTSPAIPQELIAASPALKNKKLIGRARERGMVTLDEINTALPEGGGISFEDLGRTDDPMRMYLREMGSIELLSREGEIAKRIGGQPRHGELGKALSLVL